jgi:hypothetical protein
MPITASQHHQHRRQPLVCEDDQLHLPVEAEQKNEINDTGPFHQLQQVLRQQLPWLLTKRPRAPDPIVLVNEDKA